MTVVELDTSVAALGDVAHISGEVAEPPSEPRKHLFRNISFRRISLPTGTSSGFITPSEDQSLPPYEGCDHESKDQDFHTDTSGAAAKIPSGDLAPIDESPPLLRKLTRRASLPASLPASTFVAAAENSLTSKRSSLKDDRPQSRTTNPESARPSSRPKFSMLRMGSQHTINKHQPPAENDPEGEKSFLKLFHWKSERPNDKGDDKKLAELTDKLKEMELKYLNQEANFKQAQKEIKRLGDYSGDLERELRTLRCEVGQFRVKEQVYVLQIRKVTKDNDDLKKKVVDLEKRDHPTAENRPIVCNFEIEEEEEEIEREQPNNTNGFGEVSSTRRQEIEREQPNNTNGFREVSSTRRPQDGHNDGRNVNTDSSTGQLPNGPLRGVKRLAQMGQNLLEQRKAERQFRREIAANRQYRRREARRRQRESRMFQREARRRQREARRANRKDSWLTRNLALSCNSERNFEQHDENNERQDTSENGEQRGFKCDGFVDEDPPRRGLGVVFSLCSKC